MNTNNRNLTLLTDLYELTMMQGYFKSHSQKRVVFDVFYRQNPCGGAYAIACGLDQAIDYIKNLHFEPEDIDYLRCTGFFKEDFLDYLKVLSSSLRNRLSKLWLRSWRHSSLKLLC